MATLLHIPFDPACRIVRVTLLEKGVSASLEVERSWERRDSFLALNPAGDVPVLVDGDGTTVMAVGRDLSGPLEYLEEVYPDPALIGTDPVARAEVRRLIAWFTQKFGGEVTDCLAGEKLLKLQMGGGTPEPDMIRIGKANIDYHLDYIAYLVDRRHYLAGETVTLADIAAACHLSVIDYTGDVPWEAHPQTKEWYARIKCRPSFRPLLEDRIAGRPPAAHYADLDF